jgi:Sulfotransferase domain
MKCFVISLHRSGTQSTAELLRMLGLRTIHWPACDRGTDLEAKIEGRETELEHVLDTIAPVIERYHAAADVPLPALHRHLYSRYPGARFVLLHRDPVGWVRSVRNHIGERELAPFERVQYWHYFRERPGRLVELSDADLAWMHLRHTAEVTEFFARCSVRQFLASDLNDIDCGTRISDFLGCGHVPALPYYALHSGRDGISRRLRLAVSRARRRLGDVRRKASGAEPVL